MLLLILIIIIIWILIYQELDYRHNKGRIKLEKLTKPKHDNYLIGLYLGGIKNIKSGKILLEKNDNKLIFHIENKDGIKEISINLNDIVEQNINIKPYYTQRDSIKNHSIDDGTLYFSGTPKSNDDDYIIGKTLKIKKSYSTKLRTKNNDVLELIFFNNPKSILAK